jgi:hypothetical protein
MRTHFEPDQDDEFEAAKELLIRRCMAWAAERGVTADPFILTAAMDFRHYSIDGRLGFWTVDLTRQFLLSWMPQRVSITAADAANAPDTLLTLLRYLHHTALDDPGSDPLAAIEAALAVISGELQQAMSDERNFGPTKFWAMQAIASGVDPTDRDAMQRFADDANSGRIAYDQDTLQHIVTRQVRGASAIPERACMQPPVSLPSTGELTAMAENNRLVVQLRTLTDWVGRTGRPLTATGQLKLVDARELVTLLGTDDVIDPVVGDRVWHTKSSADLPELSLIVDWAKQLRLLRVVKNRLVQIAKSQPLLHDPLLLWTTAFTAFSELADAVVRPMLYGQQPGMLHDVFTDVVPDVLNTVYGMPAPMPVVCLAESVWTSCQAFFAIEDATPAQQEIWRHSVNGDLRRMLATLATVGGMELAASPADPMFRSDLTDGLSPDSGIRLPQEVRERLRTALAPSAGPVETVVLTPLGTYAVRTRLRAEGRHAPLIGELTNVGPGQLLGMVCEYHTLESGQEEITRWLAAHGDPETGVEQLLGAVRHCPFRSRTAAMLDVLTAVQPDPAAWLRRLRSDTVLGPIAVQFLTRDGQLSPDDLTGPESLLVITEQLLQLLEAAGPDAVRTTFDQTSVTMKIPNLFTAVLESGHPDATGLDELRTLVIEPLERRGPRRPVTRARLSRPGHPSRPKNMRRKR